MTPVRLVPLLTVAVAVVGFAGILAPPATAAVPVAPAQAEKPWRLTGDLAAHDPALVAGGGGEDWYVFATGEEDMGGGNIQIRSSPDGHKWTYQGTVWDEIPAWITEAVPGVKNLWAPEIFEHGGT